MADVNEVLRRAELFKGLDESEYELFESIEKKQSVRAGEYLFMLGDDADRMHLVLTGQIELCFPLSIGGRIKDATTETLGPARALGWSALVKPYRFTLSARASEPSTVTAFTRSDLLRVFEDHPPIGCMFMSRIAELVGNRLAHVSALWARELQRMVSDPSNPLGLGSSSGTDAPQATE